MTKGHPAPGCPFVFVNCLSWSLLPDHDRAAADGPWLADRCTTDVHRDIREAGANQVERLTRRAREPSRPDRIHRQRPAGAPVVYPDTLAGADVPCRGRLVTGRGVLAAVVDALVHGGVRSAANPQRRRN